MTTKIRVVPHTVCVSLAVSLCDFRFSTSVHYDSHPRHLPCGKLK